ncbi:MAG: transcription termination/antitermination protein NusG [Oligoflexia bacterium]|nr:transcription termination/antitermination protein NusG [Oligoflexia bacterium]
MPKKVTTKNDGKEKGPESISNKEHNSTNNSTNNKDEQKQLAKGDTPDFRWYIVHVLTGHEKKVEKALLERIFNHHYENYFSDILVPEEKVMENRGGKKREIKKKFFPGYILIKMVMSEKTWHLVKSTDKITGFIGANKNKPSPITEEEAAQLTNQAIEGFKKARMGSFFSEGDSVRVIEGPFASFIGTVDAVLDKGRVRVQVSIFGRPTPVELDFSQIEKV